MPVPDNLPPNLRRLADTFQSMSKINILLGKNGSGKSHLLKQIEPFIPELADGSSTVRYLSPERGGVLEYDPGIEHNMSRNIGWLNDSRRKNQAVDFRKQSAAQYRKLELAVLREIEADPVRRRSTFNFNEELEKINGLLDRVLR